MPTSPDDVLEVLREIVDDRGEPVATAPEISEELPIERRTVLTRLDVLDERGDVDSKKVGRSRVFWLTSLVDDPPADPSADPSADPIADPPGEAGPSRVSPGDPPADPSGEPPADPSADPPADSAEPDADLQELVDAVDGDHRGWREGDNVQRREAALAALQWLRESGDHCTAGDAKDALLPAYAVDGQDADAFWRHTVRPVFQEAVDRGLAEFRAGHYDYRWTA